VPVQPQAKAQLPHTALEVWQQLRPELHSTQHRGKYVLRMCPLCQHPAIIYKDFQAGTKRDRPTAPLWARKQRGALRNQCTLGLQKGESTQEPMEAIPRGPLVLLK